MTDLEKRVAGLSPEKRQLLKLRLEQMQKQKLQGKESQSSGGPSGPDGRMRGKEAAPSPTKRERPDPLPLSFAQQRLWFLAQWDPDSSLYNIPAALHLRGALNEGALKQTLNEIVRRHEALRTTFVTREGQPAQVIAPELEMALPVTDLSRLPEGEHGCEALRLATEEARRPFDLTRGPLFRAHLLRLEDDEHILLLTVHHIVSDGWSMRVLVHEMSALYEAFTEGRPSPLAELPIQYADYTLWQREWLEGDNLQDQLAYWKARLANQEAFLDLPTDHPRPAVQVSQGSSQSFYLGHHLAPASLLRELVALSQREGATLFMTVLAAFEVLLSRYSRQEDICVGVPVANRNYAELEGLVGFFVNTLVMRTDLSGDPTFRELLQRVRETVLGAMAHQDLPFEMLVEALQPQRDTSYAPLFQVMFDLASSSPASSSPASSSPASNAALAATDGGSTDVLRLRGLRSTLLEVDRGTSKFDLSLFLEERPDGLKGTLEYNTDLFGRQTIARMSAHLGVLLEAIVADPDQRISRLPMLTEAERTQLLATWTDTDTGPLPECCIHELFEAQAERTPDAAALIFQTEELSYRELDERANRLAHRLRALGVGPESLVGVCLKRTPDMVVALLAILKAGGAYVPLDPQYPQERLGFMLEDSRIKVLLSQRDVQESLPAHQARVIYLDDQDADASPAGKERVASGVTPRDLAYVLFTSGSTGRPKGVAIEHRSAIALIHWARRVYSAQELAGVLAATSISFDLSVYELFLTLSVGGTIILAENVLQLPELPARERVTLVNTVPSAMAQLLRSADIPASVRTINLAGEPLPASLVDELYRRPQVQRVYDLYGPTEDTTYSTWTLRRPHGPMTIGRPIDNTQVYLLDGRMQPVPVGVPGELYLGGAGLARGYLNRPELTAERFVPNPFGVGGARLYRTGDLARYLPDGNIQFLGRIDNQVKVRGFRIELGEIEAILERDPSVRQVVVTAREDNGDKRLVAYLSPKDGETLSVERLRGLLQQRLPAYMIPAAFVVMDALPVTPTGKVNRRALPAPEWSQSAREQTYRPPRDTLEEALCQIWQEVLAMQQVGIGDNFFEIGGHSLLATQVVSRVRQVLGVDIPLRAVFEAPTVEKLAGRIRSLLRVQGETAIPPIEPVSREGLDALPLSFAQQRLWFLDQLEPNTPLYNVATAVRLRGKLDVAALEYAVNEVIRRHEALRTTFAMSTERGHVVGQAEQVVGPAWKLSLAVQDLRDLPVETREREALRLAGEEAKQPFDLSRGPLLRVRLLRLGMEEHIVLLTMHHIISDGWSLGVLLSELAEIYGPASRGQEARMAPLRIQYADYAMWQRQWLQGDVLEQQLAYWREQLKALPPLLEMPTDHPRPALQGWRGGHELFALPAETTRGLKELGQREGVTLFMTLLAGFQALLYRYSGQTDISVGTPIANRTHADLEKLIGFFVNTLVLRTRVDGAMSFQGLLQSVREVALGAYSHQDAPFEMLVDALQPHRDTSHTPLFQVMFVLQTAGVPSMGAQGAPMRLALPGLSMEPLDVDAQVAPFDLTLTMYEQDGTLQGNLEYNSDLYEAATVRRMIGHLKELLQGCVRDPQCEIEALPLLSDEERQQVLVSWNDTAREYPDDLCMHHLFEASAARNPQAIALVYRDVHVTYGELNERANRLAHYLRRRGVGPDVLVGLCLERSIDMAVALLGTLKAGGAYLPLDPAFPTDRLAMMVRDSGAPVILTQASLAGRLPDSQAQVILLDLEWPRIEREADAHGGYASETPASGVTPDNLAYVIYTSGSTGQPKGVMVVHRGVVNHNLAVMEIFGLGPSDRVLQFSTINFDAAVEEFFPTWASGATVVLRPEGPLLSGIELLELIEREHLTVLDLPTAYWHEWVYELSLSGRPLPSSLRLVVVGGDKVSSQHLATWQRLARPELLWLNTYGPTEGTIIASTFGLRGQEEVPAPLPIGKPLPNVRLYILDRRGQPSPVGVPGELFIAGAGVARGYLNRPDLTAERFWPDPFASAGGARMYRTGDLARFLPDGNIEFLGRNDEQVKVRGFRIELGEVEAALKQSQGVRDAIVLAREEDEGDGLRGAGNKRLVAYVILAGTAKADGTATLELAQEEGAQACAVSLSGADATALRNTLLAEARTRLPEFMVPSTIIFLDAWPLTSTGKVDRRALPWPAPGQATTAIGAASGAPGEYVAPRTEPERVLAEIWQEVLRQDRVGVNDNFFELGGDSILSIQVIARAGQAGLSLTPRQLFQEPTIAGLAALASQQVGSPALQAEQGLVQGPVPLTPIQCWFFEQDLAEAYHWNQAVLLRVHGWLEPDRLSGAMAALLRHHDALRMRYRREQDGQDSGRWVQWNDGLGEEISLPHSDLSGLSAEEQDATIEREACAVQASLNLETGPLFRMAYWHLGEERGGRLLLVAHHLVMDGISWRVLLEDLQRAYRQLQEGQQVHLPAKTTSFREWAHRLAAYARSEPVTREADYWRSVVARGAGMMPVDMDGENTESSARVVAASLSQEETQALLQESATQHIEINAVLLAALQQAFAAWMGERDLMIGLEGHGREPIEEGGQHAGVDISRTVGWFTTLYPVRLPAIGQGNPDEALRVVSEQLRRVPGKGIGYGLLRYLGEDAQLQRDLRMQDLPVSFNYLGQFDQLLADKEADFALASESIGPSHSPLARRTHLIEVSGMVVEGRLRMEWSYSENIYKRETIEDLVEAYVQALRQIIGHCLTADTHLEEVAYVDEGVSQTDMDAIMAELNQTTGEE